MTATPGQQALDARNLRILNHEGDWADSKDVNWASGQVAALKGERAQQNRGAYTMGANYANPGMLAAMGAQEEAQAAQADALGSERAIGQAIDGAGQSALASGGLTASRYGSVMNNAGNLASGYNQNYVSMQNQPGFWSQALLGVISGASGLATGGLGAAAGGAVKAATSPYR